MGSRVLLARGFRRPELPVVQLGRVLLMGRGQPMTDGVMPLGRADTGSHSGLVVEPVPVLLTGQMGTVARYLAVDMPC